MIKTNKIWDFFLTKNSLNRLILINVALFIGFFILKLFFVLIAFLMNNPAIEMWSEEIIRYMSMPAFLPQILYQPWALLTSLFFHAQFWHLFFNMVMLYVTGRIFMLYLSEKKLITTYLLGGLCGNALYVAAYNCFPAFAPALPTAVALGASGSIMAILAAITVYKPNHEIRLLFFGRITLKWLMLIFIAIDLLSIPKGNAGGHIAHLGGVFFGAIYALILRNGILQQNFTKKKKKKRTKFSTSFDSGYNVRNMSDEEYNANKTQQRQKIDKILDKVSKSGYDALSKEEKEFLFSYSRQYSK
ncbi:MAG: rhomboid family intramembrane serine protease [Bacteroidales bacterium]|jgi:membrane associated rhomboid family serine protease|nr:rhomboid family intramembrane serine protease [Bacteroidales bacterium]